MVLVLHLKRLHVLNRFLPLSYYSREWKLISSLSFLFQLLYPCFPSVQLGARGSPRTKGESSTWTLTPVSYIFLSVMDLAHFEICAVSQTKHSSTPVFPGQLLSIHIHFRFTFQLPEEDP